MTEAKRLQIQSSKLKAAEKAIEVFEESLLLCVINVMTVFFDDLRTYGNSYCQVISESSKESEGH